MVNLGSVSPWQNGWFKVVTKFGQSELKMNGVKDLGVFDHVWKDPQATWQVYSRVVPNGEGSMITMTLFKPPAMDDRQFDFSMKEMDIELAKLKEILERQRVSGKRLRAASIHSTAWPALPAATGVRRRFSGWNAP